jgi:hypothetical protein
MNEFQILEHRCQGIAARIGSNVKFVAIDPRTEVVHVEFWEPPTDDERLKVAILNAERKPLSQQTDTEVRLRAVEQRLDSLEAR